MDFGTEQKPLCGICGCACPEQACNWCENGTLNNDVICMKCDEKYEYDDENDSYELKMTAETMITFDGCGCSVVRDSKDHDEAICDDNGENWMCGNCYDGRYDEKEDEEEEEEEEKKPKTLKIVGFYERDHYKPLAERFYKDGRVADTYISGEDIINHFEEYYDTETLARVIDAGMEESWLLCRHEGTDELNEDSRGWIGEMIWSIEDLDGVFLTKYNTSSGFAMWLSCLEWCECEESCDE